MSITSGFYKDVEAVVLEADQYNIAPEPASAAMDRIDFSKMWDMGSSIGPFEKKSWHLAIEVSEEK